MGLDNQLFSFVRDGQREGMAITIVGSKRSLNLKTQTPVFHETSQQTERRTTGIDRGATTRDRVRERQGRRYSRDIDVRYLSSWKSLKEKLLSGYSCNQNQCPMIKERLTIHNQSKHCGRRCDKKSSFQSSSKSKNCVSIRAGPDIDQYSDEKCSDCESFATSSSYNKLCHNRAGKRNTRNDKYEMSDKKCTENCTSTPYSGRTKNQSSNVRNRFDEYVDTSSNKQWDGRNRYNQTDYSRSKEMDKYNKMYTASDADNGKCCTTTTCHDNRRNSNRNSCNDLSTSKYRRNSGTNVYMPSGRFVDSCTTPSNVISTYKDRNGYANECCDVGESKGYYVDSCTGPIDDCTEYIDRCGGYKTSYKNECTNYDDTKGFVEGCPNYTNYKNDRNCVSGGYDSIKLPDCKDMYTSTYSQSYISNIEAPKFPIVRSLINLNEDSVPSTSKNYKDKSLISKIDTPTNTPTMVDNGNTSEKQSNDLTLSNKVPVDDATGNDPVMSSLINIVTKRKHSKDKIPKTSKQSTNKNNLDSTTSYSHKALHPKTDRSSTSKIGSRASLNSNTQKHRRNSNSNPIYKEVKEWIREVPMYPGLEKKDKDKSTGVINDLVNNLYKLSEEAGSPEYDEKIKNEIDSCLDKIPLWYPGAKSEQTGFKRRLADRLTQRLKKVNRKNVGNYSKPKRKNAVTAVHTSLTSCNPSFITQVTNDPRDIEIKICVIEWLRLIYSKTKNASVLKNKIFLLADFVTFRINALLKNEATASDDTLILKTAILNLMNDLPIITECPLNNNRHIQEHAEDLANKLLCIQAKYKTRCKNSNISTVSCGSKCSCQTLREILVRNIIKKCIKDSQVDCNNMILDEAGEIMRNCYKTADPKPNHHARNEMINLLVTSTNLSEAQAWNLAKIIIKNVRKIFDEEETLCANSQTCSQVRQTYTTSVYTSIEEPSQEAYFLTSTPKKKREKKEVPKLNPEEMQYMKDVAKLVRSWMNTLPYDFNTPDEQNFKDTMINDLASDIMDEAKLGQLVPRNKNTREIQKYVVCRWIYKLNAFEINEVDDQIETFLNELQNIPVPIMTRPQYGNRQAMENLKYNKLSNGTGHFIPKGTDVLEDEISIWMHEQPSTIFKNNDQQFRHDKIHELALDLEKKLGQHSSKKDVSKDISIWLNKIVKPENKHEIKELTENLKGRVIDLPQDATLAGIVENKIKLREEQKQFKLQKQNASETYTSNSKNNETADPENTMAIFISKFMDHHYNIDDPLARRAFNRLLTSHLLSLNQCTRKEICDNCEINNYGDKFPSPQLLRELEYVKDVSDWLKNIPIDASYNSLGNSERIDFVNSLALTIREVEEDRENNPDAMDYDNYLSHMILEHMQLLPLPKQYHDNVSFMIAQLYEKIIMHRQALSDTIKATESINTSGVNSDNIGDFIEEFIRVNGDDIAHDEVKMEAWAIRLIREIKKIVPNISRPLSKAHMYEKIADVPVPSDETAKFFDLELGYVEEVTNWIKNLPLLPMNQCQKENITNDICELAEKMIETDKKKLSDPNNDKIDTDFKEYLEKWILKLPLHKKQDIVLPVIIQQLMNRMEKMKQNEISLRSRPSETNVNKNKVSKKSSSSIFEICKKKKNFGAKNLTDCIEKWSNALPIKAENDIATLDIKNDVSRKIFQEVLQLNMNPTINNDDIMYNDKLEEEINNILESIPQNNALQKEKEKLKADIVNTILKIKNNIKENSAGTTYKSQLEKTIDYSIPNPIPCYNVYDPGFEMYKDRLATVFILENFDHGSDAVKTKYKKLLQKEIDRYFIHASNRNAIPLSEDQLYNELYSVLFRVPIPNEVSIIDEVEKLKTRCEIDAWFEELPMREAFNLNELLDWDKMLSSLATRIHEIEKTERNPESNQIVKEIMKTLVKFPLLTSNESEHKNYAINLEKKLKSTRDHRKCVRENSKTKGKKNKSKARTKELTKKRKKDNITGSNCSNKIMPTTLETENKSEQRIEKKNPADEIYEIVNTWCNELMINDNQSQNVQILKDDLTTKIIIKISELNATPNIFNNDNLYNEVLGEELEKIYATIPKPCDYCDNNAASMQQLLKKITSVKPHITEENNVHKYRQNMIKIVDKVLDRREKVSPEIEANLNVIRNDIIDDFVQYKYSNDDAEGKQGNKENLQEEISIFSVTNANVTKNSKIAQINTLMKTNQLISELSKLSPQSNNIGRNMVEEIRMKKEVADFFNEIGVSDKDVAKVNCLKTNLARNLYDIELNGYNTKSENKMKQEILKYLKKLGKEKNLTKIDAFITKLKNSEKDRRMPELEAEKRSEIDENDCDIDCPSRKPNLSNVEDASNIPANFAKKNSRKNWNVNNCTGNDYILNEIDEETASSDEDDEQMDTARECEKCRKRRPYCIIPIPMRCFSNMQRNIMMNPFCYGVPLPFF